jgi:hypothetical protein
VLVVLAFAVTFIVPMVMVAAMPFAIMGNVHFVIPIVPHEVDRLAARVVFMAVLTPLLFVAGRNVQVDRLLHHAYPHWLDNHRLGEHQLWLREVAYIDVPIKTRLTDRYRYPATALWIGVITIAAARRKRFMISLDGDER